ncbi:hypothetical protein PtA15_14A122 [Puccinia triticina]|uniref:Uncharacterized protein n=1 Tax=Puccinia triticina TaxID=208348 RepID=A0ABY7D1Y0_9BASI|nr:uncharacterized protein PtA15_14A122 [Puccinia triticina]WAQ91240.1 hypothetical protein PtA15_14A122 [Puccinia triticina]
MPPSNSGEGKSLGAAYCYQLPRCRSGGDQPDEGRGSRIPSKPNAQAPNQLAQRDSQPTALI